VPETVGGVPVHPLVVHAVVVLLPLAAVGVIVIAAVPRWRRALGFTVLCVTVVATGLVPVATESGEQLEDSIGGGELVERHSELGETLIYFAVPLLLVAIVLWWSGRRASDQPRSASAMSVVLAVVAMVVGLAAIVQVVRVGHSGAEAVWSGVVASGGSAVSVLSSLP
jgi:hypothetical protein